MHIPDQMRKKIKKRYKMQLSYKRDRKRRKQNE